MDSHDRGQNEEDALKPSFHTRLTTGGDNGDCDSVFSDSVLSNSSESDIRCRFRHTQQNVEHCHHTPLSGQNETSYSDHQTIDIGGPVESHKVQGGEAPADPLVYNEPQNHKSGLHVKNSSSTSNNQSPLDYKKLDRHHHKSQELFISPDLSQDNTPTLQPLWGPPSPAASSPPDSLLSSSPVFTNLSDLASLGSYELLTEDSYKTTISPCGSLKSSVSAMSHNCNFINMWSATKRRSSSVSPSASKIAKEHSNSTTTAVEDCDDYVVVSNRRASSSDGLDQGPNRLVTRSASGNHLAMMDSTETICDDQHRDQNSVRFCPLEIEIDTPSASEEASEFSADSDALQVDDEDPELLELKAEALYWERQVEELERRQFADDVPRTLIENIMKHRKELRELEFQIYELSLNSEHLFDQDQGQGFHEHGRAGGLSPRSASKFGSRIKPGQENTADILNAVPPSGSLQHRQYLSKASSGTDTSEYSQLPRFEQYSHRIGVGGGGQRKCSHRSRRQEGQGLLHAHVDGANRVNKLPPPPDHGRMRSSPVRPNHFKGEFRSPKTVIAQDSSSTASSESPPH